MLTDTVDSCLLLAGHEALSAYLDVVDSLRDYFESLIESSLREVHRSRIIRVDSNGSSIFSREG